MLSRLTTTIGSAAARPRACLEIHFAERRRDPGGARSDRSPRVGASRPTASRRTRRARASRLIRPSRARLPSTPRDQGAFDTELFRELGFGRNASSGRHSPRIRCLRICFDCDGFGQTGRRDLGWPLLQRLLSKPSLLQNGTTACFELVTRCACCQAQPCAVDWLPAVASKCICPVFVAHHLSASVVVALWGSGQARSGCPLVHRAPAGRVEASHAACRVGVSMGSPLAV